MKNQLVLFFIVLLLIELVACSGIRSRAISYRLIICHTTQIVIDSSWNYTDAIQANNRVLAMSCHNRYLELVNRSLNFVQSNNGFEGDTLLAAKASVLLRFYKNALQYKFAPLLNEMKDDIFQKNRTGNMDSVIREFIANENQYWASYKQAEKEFCKRYKLNEVED